MKILHLHLTFCINIFYKGDKYNDKKTEYNDKYSDINKLDWFNNGYPTLAKSCKPGSGIGIECPSAKFVKFFNFLPL